MPAKKLCKALFVSRISVLWSIAWLRLWVELLGLNDAEPWLGKMSRLSGEVRLSLQRPCAGLGQVFVLSVLGKPVS